MNRLRDRSTRLMGRMLLLAAVPAVALHCLSACSATGYIVTLKDGAEYRTADRPALDSKTGYYKFRDRYGKDRLMRQDEVAVIAHD